MDDLGWFIDDVRIYQCVGPQGPTVTINQAAEQVDFTNVSPINFSVVFSEAVNDFTMEDVTLTGTAGATTATVTGSGSTYNVAVSGMTGTGTVMASIPAGVVTDGSGNLNPASTSTDNTVEFDITNPTVTINQAVGQADSANASPINFTVVFSEVVSGFTTEDVTLSGTAGATTATVTGSGTTYNVGVSGMTDMGTVTANIAAGMTTDAADNSNEASTSTDNTVFYDTLQAESIPAMSSPIVGSTLAGDTETFIWRANTTNVTEWWLYVGTSVGASNLHDSGSLGTATSHTVIGLPTDGSTLHVRLYYRVAGGWQSRDDIYTAATEGSSSPPTITSPVPGETLAGDTETFVWAANGTGVTGWWLYVGTSAGANNLHDSGGLGTATSHTVIGLPTDGSTLHVRLWYQAGGVWLFRDDTYTAATGGTSSLPTLTSPTPGTTLAGDTETFVWAANGTGVTGWWLYVGTSVGASNLHDSGSLGTATSHTVTGLPTDGSTLHVRLWYQAGGVWLFRDDTYTAATEGSSSLPTLTSPTPGTTLAGDTETFVWAANGTGVTGWWLYVGTSVGANNLHDSGGLGTATSHTVIGLPTDGSTLHVRLWYQAGGVWLFRDDTYTAATGGTSSLPTLTSPTPGTTLAGDTETFVWAANGTGVTGWWLYVGTSVGANNLHDSGGLGTATSHTVIGLPTDGSTLHVRLWYQAGGVWLFRDDTYTAGTSGS